MLVKTFSFVGAEYRTTACRHPTERWPVLASQHSGTDSSRATTSCSPLAISISPCNGRSVFRFQLLLFKASAQRTAHFLQTAHTSRLLVHFMSGIGKLGLGSHLSALFSPYSLGKKTARHFIVLNFLMAPECSFVSGIQR